METNSFAFCPKGKGTFKTVSFRGLSKNMCDSRLADCLNPRKQFYALETILESYRFIRPVEHHLMREIRNPH